MNRDQAPCPQGIAGTPSIAEAIEALASDPRRPGTRKLAGSEHLYRLRIGDYRVVYEIHDERLIIVVIKVGHRREVYREH